MDKNERRICWYSSLLIALMMNSPKLLALRENGIIAHYWHFDPGEFTFQTLYNLAFCYLMFYINLNSNSILPVYRSQKRYTLYAWYNGLIFLACITLGSIIQYACFNDNRLPGIFGMGYFARFGLSLILVGIVIKILLLLRDAKRKEIEHEQLKIVYMAAELELLKEQMNPHFLFNSLSSLSGVIREDPDMAQKYVRELANVFRYALIHSKANLVTVEEELIMLRSFAQLITMRLENAFQLEIKVNAPYLSYKIPHLSLQPLLENAVKHNMATLAKPLKVKIYIQEGLLVISNNLQQVPLPESSNGLGLANLNDRFKIMLQQEIEIEKSEKQFTIKLPIKA